MADIVSDNIYQNIYAHIQQEAHHFEQQSSKVFEAVLACETDEKSITQLIEFLSDKLYSMRTKNIKYPRTLYQYINGCESIHPSIHRAIVKIYPKVHDEQFITSYHKQFLYNCIRGNKRAIERIMIELNDHFDPNWEYFVTSDSIGVGNVGVENVGVTGLLLALLSQQPPKFISFILSLTDKHKLTTGDFNSTIYSVALNQNGGQGSFISTLDELVGDQNLHPQFISAYFNKKRTIVIDDDIKHLFIEFEKKLLHMDGKNIIEHEDAENTKGIDYYFDECEEPLTMVKLRCQQLLDFIVSRSS